MIEMSPQIDAIAKALHTAQANLTGVKRDATNPAFRSRYATLEAVIDTARPALQNAGLAFLQAPGQIVDGSVEVTTMLVHVGGQWMRSTVHVPIGGKKDAQAVGSAISYGSRYSLMAVLGLPAVDDDGEAASAPAPRRQASAANEDTRTASQRLADEVIASIEKRSADAIKPFLASEPVKQRIQAMDDEDYRRVEAAAEARMRAAA